MPVNTSESTKTETTRRWRACRRARIQSSQAGTLAATISAPINDGIANQRQGNCTSLSFGTIAQTGRLRLVDIRKVTHKTMKVARSIRFAPVFLKDRRTRISPGSKKATTASAITLAYQVFRFVRADGEKTKFKR